MSTVTLYYNELKSAKRNALKTKDECEDYSGSIKTSACMTLAMAPGEDEAGNISTAISMANQKCSKLSGMEETFQSLANNIEALINTAENKDNAVKNKINSLAEEHFEKETFWEAFGNFLYDTYFVDVPNWLSKYCPFIRHATPYFRKVTNFLGDCYENALDWFRYDAGKYLANIFVSVGEVFGAVILVGGVVIAATVSAPVTITALVLGGTYLTCKVIDEGQKISSNAEALAEYNTYHKGTKIRKYGTAHYYGSIEGVSDYIKKNDWGSKEDNIRAEASGIVFDTTRDTSKWGLDLIKLMYTGFGLEEAAKQANGNMFESTKEYLKDMKLGNGIYLDVVNGLTGKEEDFDSVLKKAKKIPFIKDTIEPFEDYMDLGDLVKDASNIVTYGEMEKNWDELSKLTKNLAMKEIVTPVKELPTNTRKLFQTYGSITDGFRERASGLQGGIINYGIGK